jgi:hypothetical protein
MQSIQHIYTWFHALHLLRDSEGVMRVEFEVRDAGNVDEVVVHRRDRPTLYQQIKFVMSQRQLLTREWFSTPPTGAKHSPLARFHQSFIDLSTDDRPFEMALYTNRALTPNDPIPMHLDSRTALLGPPVFAASGKSATRKALNEWADHLGIPREELLNMLEHLRIYPSRGSLEELRRDCGIYMEAVGLRGDVAAVSLGTNEIRQLIVSGCEALDLGEMRELVGRLGLQAGQPRGTRLIQAITPAAWPETATASVDWVDCFAVRNRVTADNCATPTCGTPNSSRSSWPMPTPSGRPSSRTCGGRRSERFAMLRSSRLSDSRSPPATCTFRRLSGWRWPGGPPCGAW